MLWVQHEKAVTAFNCSSIPETRVVLVLCLTDHKLLVSFSIETNGVSLIEPLVTSTVADRGFPVGGAMDPLGGCGPLTRVLFGENVCENEKIGARWGGGEHAPEIFVCRSATEVQSQGNVTVTRKHSV